MGYDVHITRAKDWCENEGQEIPFEEWLAIVEADAELAIDRINGPDYAIWSGKSELVEPWLRWWRGNIRTKNPDNALIEKMVSIAKRLGAKVQGDDGEIYPGDGRDPFFEDELWDRELDGRM